MRRLAQFYLGMVLLGSSTILSAAGISVSVDRSEIYEDETFNVIITADPAGGEVIIDFSALEKDFQVLSTSKSSEMTLLNGRAKSSLRWVLMLAPKQAGNFHIPSIRSGGQSSKPIAIRVRKGGASAAPGSKDEIASGKDVFLQVSAVPEDPTVQSQVIYTVQLFFAVNLVDATLSDPKVQDAMMMRLGDDVSFQSRVNGRSYQVVERKYAISPQKVGPLTVAPPVFTGAIDEVDQTVSNFSQFFAHGGKPVRFSAPGLDLQVKPAVAGIKPWLPARKLQLTEVWSMDRNKLKVGEPVTRTVVVRAEGLTGAQLPVLKAPVIDHVKVYEDKPEVNTRFNGDRILGERIEKWAFIPSEAGVIQVPSLVLAWWNTEKHKRETAVLPGQVLRVAVGEGDRSSGVKTQKVVISPSRTSGVGWGELSRFGQLGFVLAGLLLFAWLATLWGWYRTRRKLPQPVDTAGDRPVGKQPSIKSVQKSIQDACHRHDSAAAMVALLTWARLKWPTCQFQYLAQIAEKAGFGPLGVALIALDKGVYSRSHALWDGPEFWKVFQLYLKSKPTRKRATRESLPSLTPG